jgi:hypothetical protein
MNLQKMEKYINTMREHRKIIPLGNLEYHVYFNEYEGMKGDYLSPSDPSEFEIDSIYCPDYNRDVTRLLSSEAQDELLRLAKQKL